MFMKPLIAGLGGSLRQRSYSRAGLQAALEIVEVAGAESVMLDLRELNLPMYVPDWEIEDYPEMHQAAIRHLIDVCRRADAMIWSSPTYHGTVSGVFKNALDYLEFLMNDKPPYLQGKAVGLIAVSDGITFNAMADSVYELRAWLAPTRVTLEKTDFTPDMVLCGERAIRRLTRLADNLVGFAK
jgi:FMN reductase